MGAVGTVVLCSKCRHPLAPGTSVCQRCGGQRNPVTPGPPTTKSDPPEKNPLRRGEVIEGKWRLEGKLGSGGMATVFLARDLALDREVAVKVLARELCADAQFVDRFEREARLTAKLEHPNIVPVYAVGRYEGRPFMVMKRLEGTTLSTLMQSVRRFEPCLALALLRQICAGLSHIHVNGCVHRDIKAANIFVGADGHATLLDFGVLRDLTSRGLTQAGMMLGTPRYMSPEQARGALDVDHRADLYALAVLLFECLAGVLPFDAPSDLAIINHHAQTEPPDISALDATLPPALGAMLRRALAKNPDDRFQSADEFFSAFEQAIAPAIETAPAEIAAPVPEPEPAPPAGEPVDPEPFNPEIAAPAAAEPAPVPVEVPTHVLAHPPARRHWLWPLVAGTALVLAGGQLAFFKYSSRNFAPGAEGPSETAAALVGPDAARETATPDASRPETAATPTGPAVPLRLFGSLKVASVLSGRTYAAELEVDGQEHGETPATLELPVGKHRVRVLRTGFQPYEAVVVIKPRQTTNVEVDLVP